MHHVITWFEHQGPVLQQLLCSKVPVNGASVVKNTLLPVPELIAYSKEVSIEKDMNVQWFWLMQVKHVFKEFGVALSWEHLVLV